MKSFKQIIEGESNTVTYQIECTDGEGSLKRLIEYIGENGNDGHSFEIVVDPGTENEKKFGWDGDGRDYIKSVKEI